MTQMPTAEPSFAPPGSNPPAQPLKQGMAITSLVLGIVGCCVFPVLPSIAAAILGGIAMKKAKAEPHEYGGHGMALAGLILGIIGAVIGLIMVITYGAILMSIPAECWSNPEAPGCEEALGGNNTSSPALSMLWSALPFSRYA